MTKNEALLAMNNGEKVTHQYFEDSEWMCKTGCLYEFEDGIFCDVDEFWTFRDEAGWDKNWKIFTV